MAYTSFGSASGEHTSGDDPTSFGSTQTADDDYRYPAGMVPPMGIPGMPGMPGMGMPGMPWGMPHMPPPGAMGYPPMGPMGMPPSSAPAASLPPDIENYDEEKLKHLKEYFEKEAVKYEGIAQMAADKADECRKKHLTDPQPVMGAMQPQMPPMGFMPYPGAEAFHPGMMYPGYGLGDFRGGKGKPPMQQQPVGPRPAQPKPKAQPKPAPEPAVETPDVPEEMKTTVMLKNIPNDYKRGDVKEMLDAANFLGKYDFLYVPRDFQRRAGLGYAFVNMVTPELARELRRHFEGFSAWKMASQKVCETAWGHPHQGLEAHINRYRDSPLMHPDVQVDFKPMLFKDGVEQTWPEPSRKVRKPRMKSGAREQDGEGGEDTEAHAASNTPASPPES